MFRGDADVYIQSRDLRPLDRYFPELHEALLARLPAGCVLDGEIVIATAARPRLRRAAAAPAPRRLARREAREGDAVVVRRLRSARGRRHATCATRRRASAARALEQLLGDVEPPVHLTPMTRDRARRRATGWSASRAPGSTA